MQSIAIFVMNNHTPGNWSVRSFPDNNGEFTPNTRFGAFNEGAATGIPFGRANTDRSDWQFVAGRLPIFELRQGRKMNALAILVPWGMPFGEGSCVAPSARGVFISNFMISRHLPHRQVPDTAAPLATKSRRQDAVRFYQEVCAANLTRCCFHKANIARIAGCGSTGIADIKHRQRRWHGGDLPLFAEPGA